MKQTSNLRFSECKVLIKGIEASLLDTTLNKEQS